MKRLIITFFLFCFFSAHGQPERPQNLRGKFNGKTRRMHFGFTLGYNSSSFAVTQKDDFTFNDSLISITNGPASGFNLGIIANYHVSNNLKIRVIIPTFSFEDRVLNYKFLDTSGSIYNLNHRVESTYLNFPVLLKWRTNRINNFAAYVIGGGQYGIDLASNQKVAPNTPVVRIKNTDIQGTCGVGTDFFLPFFKFGIELRYNFGLKNSFLPATNILSNPIEKLYTRGWLLSFTFEG